MIVFADIEWTWGEALLNESARDLVNIVGFGLTFFGLALAWFQLENTVGGEGSRGRGEQGAGGKSIRLP